jgi:hypothetical protein
VVRTEGYEEVRWRFGGKEAQALGIKAIVEVIEETIDE